MLDLFKGLNQGQRQGEGVNKWQHKLNQRGTIVNAQEVNVEYYDMPSPTTPKQATTLMRRSKHNRFSHDYIKPIFTMPPIWILPFPANATITGMKVKAERKASHAVVVPRTQAATSRLKLIKGAIGAVNRADFDTPWPTTDTIKVRQQRSLWGAYLDTCGHK